VALRLESPRAHLWLTAAALLLVAPALGTGLALDDHVLALLARDQPGIAGFHANPLFLFSFTSGQSEDNHALIDAGALLPWWTDEHHKNAFFRPLSSLTHVLDFRLWPDHAWLMHLHSLLWFGALLLVVAHIYRRLSALTSIFAALAFALFALDDAHGMTVAWIANRNALVAATLALPALGAHHRWLSQGWKPGAYVGPLCFALGLCAGETAVAVFGYFLAYAVALDRTPLLRRLLHLSPYVALLVLWRVVFSLLGLGSAGSGAYHDPVHEPLGFVTALLAHLPVLLSAELGLPLADVWFWGPPDAQLAIWILSVVTALAFAAIAHALLADDAEARFWMVGMVLSACAVAASVPGERLLLVPSVGGAALLAKMLLVMHRRLKTEAANAPMRLLFASLVLVHLIAAPLLLPMRAYAMNALGRVIDRADSAISFDPASAAKTVIVVNAPFDVAVSYLQVGRQSRGLPRPLHVYWLATAGSPLRVDTIDAYTLRVRPEQGFLLTAPERHYRSDPSTLRVGSTVELSEMQVRITEVNSDGRPAAAEFRLRSPLLSPTYALRYWSRGRLRPFTPPPVGQPIDLPRELFFDTLAAP
jgi:hypothetical protein